MSSEIVDGLFLLTGLLLGGVLTSWHLKDKAASDFKIALESVKTEHMAEKTALYYLTHKGYTDRSFEMLKKRLGGFEENELRKILVRAGAVRYIRSDDTEWWRLLSRSEEAYKKADAKKDDLGPENKDL